MNIRLFSLMLLSVVSAAGCQSFDLRSAFTRKSSPRSDAVAADGSPSMPAGHTGAAGTQTSSQGSFFNSPLTGGQGAGAGNNGGTQAVNELLGKADAAFRQGNLDEARATYQLILRMQANQATAHHRLAVIGDLQRNFPAAEEHYLAALRLQPNNADLMGDIGYSYLLQGRYAESERWLQQTLAVDPSHRLAQNHLATVYRDRGDVQQAAALYRQAGNEAEVARLTPSQPQQAGLVQTSHNGGYAPATPSAARTAVETPGHRINDAFRNIDATAAASRSQITAPDPRRGANADLRQLPYENAMVAGRGLPQPTADINQPGATVNPLDSMPLWPPSGTAQPQTAANSPMRPGPVPQRPADDRARAAAFMGMNSGIAPPFPVQPAAPSQVAHQQSAYADPQMNLGANGSQFAEPPRYLPVQPVSQQPPTQFNDGDWGTGSGATGRPLQAQPPMLQPGLPPSGAAQPGALPQWPGSPHAAAAASASQLPAVRPGAERSSSSHSAAGVQQAAYWNTPAGNSADRSRPDALAEYEAEIRRQNEQINDLRSQLEAERGRLQQHQQLQLHQHPTYPQQVSPAGVMPGAAYSPAEMPRP